MFDVLLAQAPISYNFNYVEKPVYIQVMLQQGKATFYRVIFFVGTLD